MPNTFDGPDLRDYPIEVVGEWASGEPLTARERVRVHLLRLAGCQCKWPLLGTRPGVGPRCRLCNTEASWTLGATLPAFAVEDAVEVLRGLLENAEDRVTPIHEYCVRCYTLALTDAIIEINKRRERAQ